MTMTIASEDITTVEEVMQHLLVTLLKGPYTQSELVRLHGVPDPSYGPGHIVRHAIMRLRSKGWMVDVPRCDHCHRALTKTSKNKPVELTPEGIEAALSCDLLRQMEAEAEA